MEETNNILEKYQDSARNLLNAMKVSIKLIDLNRKIEQEVNNTNQASSDTISGQQINKIILYTTEKNIIEKEINNSIIKSCTDILEILKNIQTKHCPDYLKLVQNQLTSIIEFINKSYIRTNLDLSDIASKIIPIINLYEKDAIEKELPQYTLITKRLREIYQFCIKICNSKTC